MTSLKSEIAKILYAPEAQAAIQERMRHGGCSLYGAALAMIRPHIRTWAAEQENTDGEDGRLSQWVVSLAVLPPGADLDDYSAVMTEGRTVDRDRLDHTPECQESYGAIDRVAGLRGVAGLAEEALAAAGFSPDECGNLHIAIQSLQPIISRRGGHATLRRKSASGVRLWIDVMRPAWFDALPATRKEAEK